eukprot:TRINITY_DN71789_c0_g1_i1.p1 TRINITY_DN71789_c0_g1~~TRINITY_DN71789_c0_g1_i1.p1  ORF type:complete len:427 (+),score=90.01 TRINITY_DN71789_c0_g1_i1:81-1361(+)
MAAALMLPQAPNFRWSTPPRYEVRSLLGRGAYATVCEAYDAELEDLVAIKRIGHLFDDQVNSKRILREVSILRELSHDCVVGLVDVFLPECATASFNELYIVTEICDSDMKKLIYADITLTIVHIKVLMYNLLRGLKYIHSAGIYHRDLKPANCFVNQDSSVKIGDFNLARAIGEDPQPDTPPSADDRTSGASEEGAAGRRSTDGTRNRRALTQHVVTRWYRDPQLILLQEGYNQSIDVWSAGCIFAELLQCLPEGPETADRGPLFAGEPSFLLSPPRQQKHRDRGPDQLSVVFDLLGTPSEASIERLERPDSREFVRSFPPRDGVGVRSVFNYVPDDAVGLLDRTLQFDPTDRILVGQALAHEFLADARQEAKETTAAKPIILDFEQERILDANRMRELIVERLGPPVGRGGVGSSSPSACAGGA